MILFVICVFTYRIIRIFLHPIKYTIAGADILNELLEMHVYTEY